jgi:hypothetical protein
MGPAGAGRLDSHTGAVTGTAAPEARDGFCPQDQFFPAFEEPHQRYQGTGTTNGTPFTLSVDTCISSNAGALGGNTFTGSYTLSFPHGGAHGYAFGRRANAHNEVFIMTLLNGNGARGGNAVIFSVLHSPQLVFQGCFPGFSGPLIDAVLTTTTAPSPTCGSA